MTAFNLERSLPLTALNSTLTPNIPASVLAGVQSGATEIREQVNFSPQASILTLNYFTVQVGSSLPTPSTTILLPARSPY